MIKKIIFTILGLILLVGGIAGIKVLQIRTMIEQGENFQMPPETVTVARARMESWESLLTSVGSLSAVQGVDVAAEAAGKVVDITFKPGSKVEKGDLLLRQNTSAEIALLKSAEAGAELARINLARSSRLLARKAVSQSEYDSADARYKQALAEVEGIQVSIAEKNVRAPFSGRLGIRLVNLGQIVAEGTAIVSLQALDPIFVDFYLPQQQARVKAGYLVRLTNDAIPGQIIEGRITAINPRVDSETRNIGIQATVYNADELLLPGMFVDVAIVLPANKDVLVVPATAILYAPYSDSVFVVEEQESGDESGAPAGMVVSQRLIRIGEKRGDFVAVVSGLEAGEKVVSTGVFKLRNGQAVVVDNTLSPDFKLYPEVQDN